MQKKDGPKKINTDMQSNRTESKNGKQYYILNIKIICSLLEWLTLPHPDKNGLQRKSRHAHANLTL